MLAFFVTLVEKRLNIAESKNVINKVAIAQP